MTAYRYVIQAVGGVHTSYFDERHPHRDDWGGRPYRSLYRAEVQILSVRPSRKTACGENNHMPADTTALALFREKAKELEDSIFVRSIASKKGFGTSLQVRVGEPLTLQRTGLSEDEIRSSVLTIRLFCQNKDRISIRRTAAQIDSLPIDQTVKDEYARWRIELNDYLNAPTSVGFNLESGPITRRFLFETFLYGFFAHLEEPEY